MNEVFTISGDTARLIADALHNENIDLTPLIKALDAAEGANPPHTIILLVKD